VAETLIFDKLSEERSDVNECNTASRWGVGKHKGLSPENCGFRKEKAVKLSFFRVPSSA
jgi:hypothetical protein